MAMAWFNGRTNLLLMTEILHRLMWDMLFEWFYMSQVSKIRTQFQSTQKWLQQNTINNQHSDIGETKSGSWGVILVGTLYLTSSLLARADESFGKKSLET